MIFHHAKEMFVMIDSNGRINLFRGPSTKHFAVPYMCISKYKHIQPQKVFEHN